MGFSPLSSAKGAYSLFLLSPTSTLYNIYSPLHFMVSHPPFHAKNDLSLSAKEYFLVGRMGFSPLSSAKGAYSLFLLSPTSTLYNIYSPLHFMVSHPPFHAKNDLSLSAKEYFLVGRMGFEPMTISLKGCCSTN